MVAHLPDELPKTVDSVLVRDGCGSRAGQTGWIFDVYPDEKGAGVHFPNGFGVEFYFFSELIVCAVVR